MSDAVSSGHAGGTRRSGHGWSTEGGALRSFFDRSGMCVARVDYAIRVVEVNTDFCRQFGRSATELDGSRLCDLLHDDVRDKVSDQFTRLLEERRTRFTERMVALRHGDPATFSGELTGITLPGPAGRAEGIMVLVRPENGGVLSPGRKPLLTPMDARILEGVAAGVSTVQLASMLYLSRGGIEYHVNILLRKLKVNNRPALVSKAYSMGLLCAGAWPPRVHPDHLK